MNSMARVMRANSRLSTKASVMGVTFISMAAACAPVPAAATRYLRTCESARRQGPHHQGRQFVLGLPVTGDVEHHELPRGDHPEGAAVVIGHRNRLFAFDAHA